MNKLFIMFILLISTVNISYAENVKMSVILPRPQSEKDDRYIYRKKLLQLILDKTEKEYGQAEAKYSDEIMTQDRVVQELKKQTGTVTIFGTPTSVSREDELNPIRIPVEKGINGYRLLLINKENISKFEKIKTLEELKQYSACFKRDWVDNGILDDNKIKVESGSDYEGLFKMVENVRCDFFPRGINEIFLEYTKRKNELANVVIENSLILYYRLPVYFFVSKTNHKLAERVQKGFNTIIEDKSFDKLFYEYHQQFIDNAKFNTRRIIQLENLHLPKETPLNTKSYWIEIKSL